MWLCSRDDLALAVRGSFNDAFSDLLNNPPKSRCPNDDLRGSSKNPRIGSEFVSKNPESLTNKIRDLDRSADGRAESCRGGRWKLDLQAFGPSGAAIGPRRGGRSAEKGVPSRSPPAPGLRRREERARRTRRLPVAGGGRRPPAGRNENAAEAGSAGLARFCTHAFRH